MATIYESLHAEFDLACEQIRAAKLRPELTWKEIPAPDRAGGKALALAAGVKQGSLTDEAIDSQAGAGRFMLLYDPSSSEEWESSFRIVCFAQAPLEIDIGLDPFISEVTWSWLTDALDAMGAQYSHIAGTATKIISEGFGTLHHQGKGAQIELRASWSPQGKNFVAHAQAWSEVLCSLAGFPHQEGAVSLDAFRNSQHHPKN